jgi:hypothetical protein
VLLVTVFPQEMRLAREGGRGGRVCRGEGGKIS